jgi:hypothetical protein
MAEDAQQPSSRFRPLRPASGPRLILAFLLGPVLWMVAVVFGAWILEHTDAIEIGLLITAVAFVVALLVMSMLWVGRRREERRYAARA